MDNEPKKTGYNTEMKREENMERMEVRTTEPQSSCKNKAESVIERMKGKYKRRRFQRNIPKRV